MCAAESSPLRGWPGERVVIVKSTTQRVNYRRRFFPCGPAPSGESLAGYICPPVTNNLAVWGRQDGPAAIHPLCKMSPHL